MTVADYFLSISCNLLAAVVFLYFILYCLRPKIEISPYIIKVADYDNPEINAFHFKMVNKSKHSAFDVRLELNLLKKNTVKKGKMDTRRTPIDLKRSFISHVPRGKSDKKTQQFAPHAVIFRCLQDIESTLNDMTCLELQITIRHGLSGLSKVFSEEFTLGSIKKGKFAYGNSLEIESLT